MISIVVPTYNRGARLEATLAALLNSSTRGIDALEILVVDDGSTVPASTYPPPAAPGALRHLRQENAGPARARNAGFRATTGDLVIFVDDDILVPPDLVLGHLRAHQARPKTVVFGRCPFPEPPHPDPLRRFLDSLGNDPGRDQPAELMPVGIVASGQISVERAMFASGNGVYREDLAIPAAEEFELSWRLRQLAIPILLAPRLVAVHDHTVSLIALCQQQYKHGLGCAEAWMKCPEIRELPELKEVIASNGGVVKADPWRSVLRKAAKRLATLGPVRGPLASMATWLERISPSMDRVLWPAYRAAIGAHFAAGVRDGFRRFNSATRV